MLKAFRDFFRTIFKAPRTVTKTFDVDLIIRWEGLRLKAYKDGGGVWTIGYGHTATAKPGMVITETEAQRLLWKDVAWAEQAVLELVVVPLTHGQRSALISFTYNLGRSQFAKSTLLKKLNKKDYEGAAKEFMRWVYDNGQFVQGLKNRRKDEVRKFLS